MPDDEPYQPVGQRMASTDGTVIDSGAVNELMRDLDASLSLSGIELDGQLSVARYIGFFDAIERPVAYNHVPPAVYGMIKTIEMAGGAGKVEDYHRLVLLTLIQQFETRATANRLPSRLRDPTISFLAGLVQRLQKPKRGQYRIDRDNFLKDLATCRLKLWPCGAESIDIASGIPRKLTLHSSPGQLLKVFNHICLRCGGFKPFFETHFDSRMTEGFSAGGYRSLYLNIAQMLRDAPHMRGVFSGSWWHDPAVADISPNLAFLNAIPVGGGAKFYRMGTDEQTVAQATRLSKERTQRVRENTYRPTAYLMVWARHDLLHWAEAETTSLTEAANVMRVV